MVTPKKYQSQEGTTLLEVMIAVAIASIALISFISLVINSMDVEDYARKITEATLVADDRLKEIERTGFPELGQSEGLVDEDVPDGFSYKLMVIGTPIEDVRQIELEILWENKKRSVNLVTFVAKR
jgi:general secretion pathway protein I